MQNLTKLTGISLILFGAGYIAGQKHSPAEPKDHPNQTSKTRYTSRHTPSSHFRSSSRIRSPNHIKPKSKPKINLKPELQDILELGESVTREEVIQTLENKFFALRTQAGKNYQDNDKEAFAFLGNILNNIDLHSGEISYAFQGIKPFTASNIIATSKRDLPQRVFKAEVVNLLTAYLNNDKGERIKALSQIRIAIADVTTANPASQTRVPIPAPEH